jgi:hypothetical protein
MSDDDRDGYAWNDSDILIRMQPLTAVYLNVDGAVIIRQLHYPDDDSVVVITGRNLPALIARLQEAVDEVADFERWERENPDEAAAARQPKRSRLPAPPPESLIASAPIAPRTLFDVADDWREPIAAHVEGKTKTSIADIAEVLHLDAEALAGPARGRIADILTDLGFEPQRDKHHRWWEKTARPLTGDASNAHVTACRNPSPIKRA